MADPLISNESSRIFQWKEKTHYINAISTHRERQSPAMLIAFDIVTVIFVIHYIIFFYSDISNVEDYLSSWRVGNKGSPKLGKKCSAAGISSQNRGKRR